MNKKGFTLVEVLVAMAILAMSAAALMQAWGGNHLRVRKMNLNNRAAFLLNEIVSDFEVRYRKDFENIPESDSGSFENYPRFTWKMESKEFEMPDLSPIFVNEEQGQELILMMVEKLGEYFNESVKELKVTVVYTKGKRSVEYSATTFMVDFDKPIPLGGLGGGGGGGAGGQGQ